jgi:hypothetical protein
VPPRIDGSQYAAISLGLAGTLVDRQHFIDIAEAGKAGKTRRVLVREEKYRQAFEQMGWETVFVIIIE